MRVLSRIFFVILLFQAFITKSAFAEPASCGFTQECDKAMVCVGATGTANDGQCILSPLVLSVCTVFNEIQDFTVYFMIFAVVALGFAFFLGKISWGMIISVILGITMIKGAILITQKTTGISGNYCNIELVKYSNSCKGAAWGLITEQSKFNVSTTYNTDPTDLCPNPMQCTMQTCKPYTQWGVKYNGNNANSQPSLLTVNALRNAAGLNALTSLPNPNRYILRSNYKTTNVTQIDSYSGFLSTTGETYFTYDALSEVSQSSLSDSVKLFLDCTEKTSSTTTNYLVCKNSCTGVVKNVSTTATTCAGAGLV